MKRSYKFILLSALLTFVLTIALSATVLRNLFQTNMKEIVELTITPTSEKAESSLNTDVNILAIIVDETTLLDLDQLAGEFSDWEIQGIVLHASGPAAPITLKMTEPISSIYISFWGDGGSGIAEIGWNDSSEQVDLFRENWGVVGWEHKVNGHYALYDHIDRLLLIWILAEIMVLAVWKISEKKYIARAIQIVFLAMMACIMVLLLFFSHVNYACKLVLPITNIKIVLIEVLIAAVGYYFWRLKMQRTFRFGIDCDKFVRICTLILFPLQVYVGYNIFFIGNWDVGGVISAANILAFGNPADVLYAYTFSKFPNNLLLMFLYAFCFKINQAVGIFSAEYQFMAVVTLCAVINSGACFLTYKTAKLYVSPKLATIAFLMGVVAFGISPWTTVGYSDTVGLIFPLWSFYLYAAPRSSKWGKKIYKALSVTVACVGYFIKPQCIIILIAIIAIEFGKLLQERQLKQVMVIGFTLVCTLFCMALIQNGIDMSLKTKGIFLNEEETFGWPHFLMMGLNEESSGGFSYSDSNFSGLFSSKDMREVANLSMWGQRVKNMGITGIAKHFAKKMLVTFNDGTYAWAVEGSFFNWVSDPPNVCVAPYLRDIFLLDGVHGAHFKQFAVLEQFVWLGTLQLALCSALFGWRKKQDEGISVLMLSLIGLILFELLFEARARYLYTHVPVFIVLGSIGAARLKEALVDLSARKNIKSEVTI